MSQVFLQSPWIHPPEPAPLRDIILRCGKRMAIKSGTDLPHGEGSTYVGYLEKGLGCFSFLDAEGQTHIFALIIPRRTFGDLDALTAYHLNLKGKVIRPSVVVLVERERFVEEISRSVELMKLYAKNAITKEECHMEGMLANFTRSLPARVQAAMRSLIRAYYPIKESGWNPLPVKLSITEIGQIVGANRSTVSVLISDWIKKDLVRRDGRRLVVHGSLLSRAFD
jgi:CRP-like cAMP-binding protein